MEAVYSPYANLSHEKQKEEAIRLGVELSLCVAEAMFILHDDIHSVLVFCQSLLEYAGNNKDDAVADPVAGRLLCVMLHVYESYVIQPNNNIKDDFSNQWEGLSQNFAFGIRELDRIVLILRYYSGGVVKQSDFEKYDHELEILKENLSWFKVVSEANGFDREVIESNILYLWSSLFETSRRKVIMNPEIRIYRMFRPLLQNQVASEDVVSRLFSSLRI